MKKICILSTMMLFVMAILLPLNLNMLNAQTFYQNCSTGQCLRYSIENDTMVSITGGSCMTGDLVIPSTVSHNGITYSVTSIGYAAFNGCSSLTSINIPNSVTSIGYAAFSGCSSLTSINIPNSVTSIGDAAFSACSSLTSITVDANNPVYDSRDNCNAIISTSNNMLIVGCQNTTIPNSVTSIGDYAFYDCSSLTSVTIPSSVTYIRISAFDGCSSLTSINIPNSVTSIGSSAFDGCSSLTSINIPDSVTSIGSLAFNGCSSLTSITVDTNNPVYDSRDNCNAIIRTSDNGLIVGCQNTIIPNSVTSIDYGAFNGCSSLSSINIPNSVTSIGNRAFSGCSSLSSINIPDSVTSIGSSAFDGCSSLTSVTIPSSVTYIYSEAFYGCSSLTSINIPNSVTSIGYAVFRDCSSLTSINIPNSVTSIGGSAFNGCSSLTSINIPNSVTSIGSLAFNGCSSLTSINIPDSVTSIGSYAFNDCSSLSSITVDTNNPVYDSRDNCNAIIRTSDNGLIVGCQNTIIPNSVTFINEDAFKGCSGLTSINIPDSVTSIGGSAFNGCSSLTSINIPNSVTSIGGAAFKGCSSLTSINIPNSVTYIGISAFDGCSSLTSINIPNSVTFIGYYAFYGCSSLTSINIPDSVTSIGSYAFNDCSSLTSVTIPNSATSIGNGAFSGCSSLSSITVDTNNPVYDSRDNCNALIRTIDNTLLTACKNTIIPASVTSIGNNAFYGNVGSDTIICLATTPPVLDGCACDFFADVPNDFRIIIPCGTLPDYRAAWSDSPYLLESGAGPGYDTSITVACPDSCYTWNGVDYCESGTYTQTLQTVHGCDSVVTLHLTIAVGIDDHNQGTAITVYPNPTSGVIHVQLTMNNVQLNNVEIQLYDAFGRLLQTTGGVRANNHSPLQTAQIDLSSFAPGIYFIKAVAESNVLAIRKVVKR